MLWRSIAGTTFVDVIVAAALVTILLGMAVPLLRTGKEHTEVMAATQYLLGQAAQARSRAVMSGAAVGLRFRRDANGYLIRSYVDADGDGISAVDISDGVDRPLEPAWRLSDKYPSARLGLDSTVPPVMGSASTAGNNPVRFGRSGILTFSPLGTSSSGTLYVRGGPSGDQFAVRVLGVTGRVRVLRFDRGTGAWVEQ